MKYIQKLNYTNILVLLYVFLFAFLFTYTYFRAEHVHDGLQFSYYYKYYLLFFAGFSFWFFVLFLNKTKKHIIILFFTSLIFLVYFYETINFYKPLILKSDFIKIFIKEDPFKINMNDKNSKLNIIKNLRKKNNDVVVPSIFPKVLVKSYKKILPLGGVSNALTVFCKEGNEYSIYKSDRYGFNNVDDIWNEKNITWFLVGDSFTQGSCVKQNENFASQINFLTKESALSVGMAGNGPLLELASLKEYSKKKPENVLWFYFERNDLNDLKFEKNSSILMSYLKKDFNQNLVSKQNQLDSFLNKYIETAKKNILKPLPIKSKNQNKFLSFNKILRLQILRDKSSLDRGLITRVDPLFKKVIYDANNFVKSWNGKFYFIYLPDKERFTSGRANDDKYLKKSQIIKIVKSLQIPIIDIHEKFFNKQSDPLDFFAHRIYGHYNPKGYAEIAKLIVKSIKK